MRTYSKNNTHKDLLPKALVVIIYLRSNPEMQHYFDTLRYNESSGRIQYIPIAPNAFGSAQDLWAIIENLKNSYDRTAIAGQPDQLFVVGETEKYYDILAEIRPLCERENITLISCNPTFSVWYDAIEPKGEGGLKAFRALIDIEAAAQITEKHYAPDKNGLPLPKTTNMYLLAKALVPLLSDFLSLEYVSSEKEQRTAERETKSLLQNQAVVEKIIFVVFSVIMAIFLYAFLAKACSSDEEIEATAAVEEASTAKEATHFEPKIVENDARDVIDFYNLCYTFSGICHRQLTDPEPIKALTDFLTAKKQANDTIAPPKWDTKAKKEIEQGALERQFAGGFLGEETDSLQALYNQLVRKAKELYQTRGSIVQRIASSTTIAQTTADIQKDINAYIAHTKTFLAAEAAFFAKIEPKAEWAMKKLLQGAYEREVFYSYQQEALALKTLIETTEQELAKKKMDTEKIESLYAEYQKRHTDFILKQHDISYFDQEMIMKLTANLLQLNKAMMGVFYYGLREPKEKMAEKFYALKKNLYWRYNPYSIIRTKSSFYY
ncbi:MAG: hypothetical protein HG435_003205 [Capnocytophaga sp.]|nr:hypothetical protein [Capnocytophaga sp.]MBB1546335.1 hypothetical protein [Capnocytophaga sp.]MBB1568504.1 hypothetical protein [Capnocytophaga sp.]